jgi:hypothetical protein
LLAVASNCVTNDCKEALKLFAPFVSAGGGQARDLTLAFSFGNPAPSSKLAVFDFDGTLGNPLTCMGQRCPNEVWDG